MRHAIYGTDAATASVAILVKETSFCSEKIKAAYINSIGANPAGFVAYSLWYNEKEKCPAELAKDYLQTLLHSVKSLGIAILIVTDANYFKYITGKQKPATECIGYACTSQLKGYEDEFTVFYIPNYNAAKHNPKIEHEVEIGRMAFKSYLTGNYQDPGDNVVHSAQYPMTLSAISDALQYLLTKPALTADIETKSLDFWEAGIATIAFAWDKHNFISMPVDRGSYPEGVTDFLGLSFAEVVKSMLQEFFEAYTGKLIPHNGGYDFKVLVYELWMENLQDYPGMIQGIEILTRDFDDTKLIAYLATNNAVENVLGLKPLSAEYMGNYAEDTTDTLTIPLDALLLYNGKDCLATWYVRDKYYAKMVADNQLTVYEEEFKPSVITLLQIELSGMPILPDKVAIAKHTLTLLSDSHSMFLDKCPLVQEFQLEVKAKKCQQFTEEAKKKIFTMDDPRVERLVFNPGSGQQVAALLYGYCGLPVLDTTDGGDPATGGDTLEKLLNHTQNPTYLGIIKALIGLSQVDKILNSFIPAFEKAVQLPDGSWRLYGNFNLGGTVSGRLSSSNPNLQNLPSNSIYGKLIKECFGAQLATWLFGGADFNSLEDMVSALTTRDPNKMKVYIDGYDGHCIRAFSYFKDRMQDIAAEVVIHGETPAIINSIKTRYPDERQDSKAPTFLLTYQGTYMGMMKNLGISKPEALVIEKNYHNLYRIADQWVADKLQQACVDGYVTGAFGLRLRTPLLAVNGPGKLNYKAAAEGRTAGNMLGQSYGMLNSRAANEFRKRVWASPYKYDIFPCALIHDAIYLFWRNTAGITKWINDNLIDCMRWCGLVELQHPTVKLGAELDIYYPTWAKAVTLKNDISLTKIIQTCNDSQKVKLL